MTTLDSRCLEAFPAWLRSLADDAQQLAALLGREDATPAAQRGAASALNYLFKSLDLIPDGLEDLGFIDDAFVVRAAADSIRLEAEAELAADSTGTLARLSSEAELVREFLDSEYGRLTKYVAGLEQGSARGRNVAAILADQSVRVDFVREVREWADGYVAPSFTRDQRNLVKLRAFLLAKLPA